MLIEGQYAARHGNRRIIIRSSHGKLGASMPERNNSGLGSNVTVAVALSLVQ